MKEIIKGSPIADSPTALLKVARAGSKERILAQESQKAWELAQVRGDEVESARLAQLIVEARAKQKDLQILAYKSAMAQREAKLAHKKGQGQPEVATSDEPNVKVGEEWMLARHLVYCDHTASSEFRNLLPSDAALAIATLSQTWEHNYLVDEARVVAVLRRTSRLERCPRFSIFSMMLLSSCSLTSLSKPTRLSILRIFW